MKINIYSYVYWPEHFLVNELSENLVEQGCRVEVSTGLPNYQTGSFAAGYSLTGPYQQSHKGYLIKRYLVAPRGRGFLRLAVNYFSNIVFGIFNIIRLQRADVHFVFATSPIFTAIPAILAAKIRGGKVVIWLQDLWPDSLQAVGASSKDSYLVKLVGRCVRWIYKNTDLILIQSPMFANNLTKYGYKGPVEIVYNWAPGVDYSQTHACDWFPAKTDRLVVVFAGNVGRAQSLDLVIDAVKEFRSSIDLWIVGDGSELQNLKTKVEAESISNIQFLGRRPIESMPALFKAADALLVSLADEPTFFNTIPSKVPAYMAAAKPLVGLLSGAGAEVIIQSKSGVCANAGDISGLKLALEKFVTASEEQRRLWGDNALSYFYENFQKDRLIKRIKNLLEGEL